MPLVKHFLLRGHVFLSLQLHVLLVGGAGVGVGFNGGVGVYVGDAWVKRWG
jgi:cobalamin biosynthesis protein CbiD